MDHEHVIRKPIFKINNVLVALFTEEKAMTNSRS